MKIILAPDKFKGSLSAFEFCEGVENGILAVLPNAQVIKLPMADGGDGTIEVINYYLKGKIVTCEVNDPLFRPNMASYLFAEKSKTAFIEMAEASGIKLLKINELDCKNTTTYGTGELIKNALDKGAKTIILGIGGSATNDCGIGMATALGFRFLNKNNSAVLPIGMHLSEITEIDDSNADLRLKNTDFQVACDVTNPLFGKNGAAHIYAAQKGATIQDISLLDKGLKDFSKRIETKYKIDPQHIKGAGAAGGMGIASKIFLNGKLTSGINLLMNLAKFDTHINHADWIITGEGKLDNQTLSGKTINGVVKRAIRNNIKVAVFCGSNELSEEELEQFGIAYSDSIAKKTSNLNDAFQNAYRYVSTMATDFAKNQL